MIVSDAQARQYLAVAVARAGSQHVYAKRVGLTKSAICQMINGRRVSQRVARHLGIEVVSQAVVLMRSAGVDIPDEIAADYDACRRDAPSGETARETAAFLLASRDRS